MGGVGHRRVFCTPFFRTIRRVGTKIPFKHSRHIAISHHRARQHFLIIVDGGGDGIIGKCSSRNLQVSFCVCVSDPYVMYRTRSEMITSFALLKTCNWIYLVKIWFQMQKAVVLTAVNLIQIAADSIAGAFMGFSQKF